MNLIVNGNEYLSCPYNFYWCGEYSRCDVNGHIEKFILEKLNSLNLKINFIIFNRDGVISDSEYEKTTKWFISKESDITNFILDNFKTKAKQLTGLLCTRYIDPSDYLLLPLDDDTFKFGLKQVLSNIKRIEWENKLPIAIWRGTTTAGFPSIRTKVVESLCHYSNVDVKFVDSKWNVNMDISKEYFGDRWDLSKQFEYKYIFIIDGAMIASNHQWVFGSGSVPLMITHPENNYWFKKYLIPMENYVPIAYDLSDICAKIEWLINNDNVAKKIMEEAMILSETLFSHEGQVNYLNEEINRLLT
jgi:hypothetical protein